MVTQDGQCSVCKAVDIDVVTCSSCTCAVCFKCAGFDRVPSGKWSCDTCTSKRKGVSTGDTPSGKVNKVLTVSSDLKQKVLSALRKDEVPPLPGSVTGSSSASSNPNLGLQEALCLMTTRLESIDDKLSSVVTIDAHSAAMTALRTDLLREFEVTVSRLEAKFVELEEANATLRNRVQQLETQLAKLSVGPDPAHKRITFIGFSSESALERIQFVSAWMQRHFSGVPCSVGNVMRGPMRSRTLTKVSYAEFSDTDTRNVVLSKIRSDNLVCECSSVNIKVKPALTQVVRSRIWALNKAYDMISSHDSARGKNVIKVSTVDARCVKIENVVVFEQVPGSSDLGTFVGTFSALVLPTGRASGSS